MPPRLKEFLKRWLISTIAVLIAALVIRGIAYEQWHDLVLATFLLGILNTVLRPFKIIFGLFTLGLFTWIINALLLLLVAAIIPAFHVDRFSDALLGALLISFISITLNQLTGTGGARVEIRRRTRRPPPNHKGGGGPVIDV